MTRHVRTRHCEVDPIHWSRYLDGEFSSARCRECEIHLADCRECRTRLRDVQRVIAACKAARRQAVPAPIRSTMRRRAREVARPPK